MKNIILLLSLFLLNTIASGQVSKTVNIGTAGTLNTLLTSTEATTVTDLTISGNIDARDFKFMRDNMTALISLDLSGVGIVSYSGAEGTTSSAITYPANEIPQRGLYNKNGLKTITLPISLTSIGDMAFASCSGLSGITFPASLVTVGQSAFSNCSGLKGDLVFPNSVTDIGASAFYQCSSLDGNLSLSSSLKTIGSSAFSYCTKLKGNLVIPNSVTAMGESSFKNCYGFTGTLTLSNSLTEISTATFANCSALSGSLVIPGFVTVIGADAFSSCEKLSGSLTFPNSVTTIGEGAFHWCYGLSGTLTIPNSVTSIGAAAFQYCSYIEELYLSKNISTIPQSTFGGFYALNIVKATNPFPPAITSTTFFGVPYSTCTLYVPIGKKAVYKAASYWSNFQIVSEMDFTAATSNAVNNKNDVYTTNGQLIVECSQSDALIQIYSVTGQLIKVLQCQEGKLTIDLPNSMYIIRLGNHFHKIIL